MAESEIALSQPVDYAWAAGIIDGEGCIRLNRTKNAKGRVSFTLRMSVSNTDPPMLRRLTEIFSAGKTYPHRHVGRLSKKPYWQWVMYAREAERAIRAMLPYMVTKRAQAEVALQARALTQPRSRHANPHHETIIALEAELTRLKHDVAA